MDRKTMNYKEIEYNFDEARSIIEIDLAGNKIIDGPGFIKTISLFIELVEYKNPRFVIFNNSVSQYEIACKLSHFLAHNVIHPMKELGVKKIFYLCPEKMPAEIDNVIRVSSNVEIEDHISLSIGS
jgi:hypothetical protein